MAIPSQQIGWSQRAKLLWYLAKQLEQLTGVVGRNIPSSSNYITLSYHVGENFGTWTYPAVTIYCNGGQVAYHYVNNYGPYTTIYQIVTDLNSHSTNQFGTYSNIGNGNIQLVMPVSLANNLCAGGTVTFSVQPD